MSDAGIRSRDPERIDRILKILRYIWGRSPQLRLLQLLGNALDELRTSEMRRVSSCGYQYEDEDLEQELLLYGKVPSLVALAMQSEDTTEEIHEARILISRAREALYALRAGDIGSALSNLEKGFRESTIHDIH